MGSPSNLNIAKREIMVSMHAAFTEMYLIFLKLFDNTLKINVHT